MKITTFIAAAALVTGLGAPASFADESQFLQSLEGKWSGTGSVKVRTNKPDIKVRCNIDTSTTDSSLSLDGKCTGMLVVSKKIGANLKVNGASYAGSYVGAASGTANLNGKRAGNAINLGVKWAKEINGDRTARMTVEKVGENGLRLTTVDKDPETGKSVVTSQINLKRS